MKWTVWELELSTEEAKALIEMANGKEAPEAQSQHNNGRQPQKKRAYGKLRLAIEQLLAKRPMTSSELAQALKHDSQKMSAYLAFLKQRKIVARADGRWHLVAPSEGA